MLGTSTGMQSLYVYDGTGNPAALLTSAPAIAFAYDYDPYGVPTLTADSGGNGTSQNPYTFKAGIQDRVTGWVKYGQRWYNSTTGRWTQQDTLDAPLNPANANRYAYAANEPINNSDPIGLASEGAMLFGGIIGGIVGTAFGAIVSVATVPFVTPAVSVSLGVAIGGCVIGAIAVGAGNAYDNQSTSASSIAAGCVATGTSECLGNAIRSGLTS